VVGQKVRLAFRQTFDSLCLEPT